MPFYHKLGEVPPVRHTTFYKPDGKSLYREELVSSKGFSDIYSNKYHINMPTAVIKVSEIIPGPNHDWPDAPLNYYHFYTDKSEIRGDFITARVVFLENNGCALATARITEESDDFYRNAYASEYIFVHHGSGELLSEYGQLPFAEGDQLIIPRATTYQLKFNDYENNKLLIVESATPFEIPSHFRTHSGQFTEDAPYAERDFKLPEYTEAIDRKGEFRMVVKAGKKFFEQILPHYPFDLIGWDGYLYPYAFNIKSYHAKVGRVHLPPPIHIAFKTQEFVLCNFVPRPYDFHPDAIPAPYFHSNIDSDEVLYYVDGDFMSRKGVVEGSITLHPCGMPHGPQPGRTEDSVGAKETNEWAVMVDTFAPLRPTLNVKKTLDEGYPQSWLE